MQKKMLQFICSGGVPRPLLFQDLVLLSAVWTDVSCFPATTVREGPFFLLCVFTPAQLESQATRRATQSSQQTDIL